MTQDNGKSSTGLQANIVAPLSYLFGFITGIVFLILEKENKFVRFHAMQSVITFGGLFILQWVLVFTIFLIFLVPIISIVSLVLWILLMIKAYQGEMFKLPFVGDIAEKKI